MNCANCKMTYEEKQNIVFFTVIFVACIANGKDRKLTEVKLYTEHEKKNMAANSLRLAKHSWNVQTNKKSNLVTRERALFIVHKSTLNGDDGCTVCWCCTDIGSHSIKKTSFIHALRFKTPDRIPIWNNS